MQFSARCTRAARMLAVALFVFGATPALADPSDDGPVDTDVDEDDGYDMPRGKVEDPDELKHPDAQPRAHDEIKYPDAQPRAHDEIDPDQLELPDADAP